MIHVNWARLNMVGMHMVVFLQGDVCDIFILLKFLHRIPSMLEDDSLLEWRDLARTPCSATSYHAPKRSRTVISIKPALTYLRQAHFHPLTAMLIRQSCHNVVYANSLNNPDSWPCLPLILPFCSWKLLHEKVWWVCPNTSILQTLFFVACLRKPEVTLVTMNNSSLQPWFASLTPHTPVHVSEAHKWLTWFVGYIH